MSRGVVLIAAFLLAACARDETPVQKNEQGADGPALTRVTEEGPIKATISLTPREPQLGDLLSLTLIVEAAADVAVEMPAFGEALGRFSILDFTPRREVLADGSTLHSQRYTLQAPMSGRQRIPPLRLEYLDARAGRADAAGDDYRELLTEEITVGIASVFPQGQAVDTLRPARPPLPELQDGWLARFWPWLVFGAAAMAVLIGAVIIYQRTQRQRARITAYERALRRLAELERRSLPSGAGIDEWYVELSDIVRRFLEDQFGVRAPELTTEEFLLEARRSAELNASHRDLLSAFLERCDRVKFAAYNPDQNESRDALALARRFFDETRLVAEGAAQPAV